MKQPLYPRISKETEQTYVWQKISARNQNKVKKNTILMAAASFGNVPLVEALLARKAEPNQRRRSPRGRTLSFISQR